MNVTEVERADVFCDEARAGVLERTARGSRFVYDAAFLETCRRRGWGLGFERRKTADLARVMTKRRDQVGGPRGRR